MLWGGTPGRLLDAAIDKLIEIASSTALLAELQGVLSRAKFAKPLAKRGLTVSAVFDGYAVRHPGHTGIHHAHHHPRSGG